MKWWVLAAAALCGFFGALLAPEAALPQSASDSFPSGPSRYISGEAGCSGELQAATSRSAKPSLPQRSYRQSTAARKPALWRRQTSLRQHPEAPAPSLRASAHAVRPSWLRPACVPWRNSFCRIAPSPAYAGVEAYARAHAKEDAGALAWLVLGYAHVLDRDYAKAIDPLNRAKVHAGDLGDYVAYYLGTSYLQTGRTAEALANLADFAKAHPDSLLVRDAHVSYADALLLEGQAGKPQLCWNKIRVPIRSDLEFALGRAYAASGQTAKAAETFANIYYTMPGRRRGRCRLCRVEEATLRAAAYDHSA